MLLLCDTHGTLGVQYKVCIVAGEVHQLFEPHKGYGAELHGSRMGSPFELTSYLEICVCNKLGAAYLVTCAIQNACFDSKVEGAQLHTALASS